MWLFIIGLLTEVIVTIIGYKWYPKLVPRAEINIGLAATRYASYENTFRLVIYVIILSGLVLPFLRSRLF
jgi:hypothetical protein